MIRPPIPSLHYDDAHAAIEFLSLAFGFELQFIKADERNPSIVYHAELKCDGGLIMLGSALPGEVDERYPWRTPRQAGAITACISLIVSDLDAHHAQAKDAGAEIISPPRENRGFPGRTYDARDPEGYLWNITTYDPWASKD
jgi:uncharacterized glyoxalase superfamily protein PhnB